MKMPQDGQHANHSYSPHWLAKLLHLTPTWLAYWKDNEQLCVTEKDGSQDHFAIDLKASVVSGWFFTTLELTDGNDARYLRGMREASAYELAEQINHRRRQALAKLREDLSRDLNVLQPIFDHIWRAICSAQYLAASERNELEQLGLRNVDQIHAAKARVSSPHAKNFQAITDKLTAFLPRLIDFIKQPAKFLDERNKQFVEEEWRQWKPFFAQCELTPLTEEQGKAAITMEEATLLVAAAGSGKTSTVVGKVAYMLAKGLASPSEILCLAFNKGAAKEIGERVQERLAFILSAECEIPEDFKAGLRASLVDGGEIASKTFHSFGLSIIQRKDGNEPSVVVGNRRDSLLAATILDCRDEPLLAEKWWLLQTVYRFPLPLESRFENEVEYNEYLQAVKDERRQQEGISTMGTIHPVRSLEEAAISNWLYLHGVVFDYELPFDEGAEILCPGRTWRPDFSYRIITPEGDVRVVHEHFAINEDGKAPKFFADPEEYVVQSRRKKEVLQQLSEHHFWTTSAEYRDGSLFSRLQHKLEDLGVQFNAPSEGQKLKRLQEIGLDVDDELLEKAVSQIRANEWSFEDLNPKINGQSEKGRARVFLEVAVAVADRFSQMMKDSNHLDFDSMIRQAIGYLREDPNLSPYRVILADEFQDTAAGRAKLIREALKNKPNARLFGVGDDWQAINRFAGSDISLFTGFKEAFSQRDGGSIRCDLTQTFRTNQGIADISTTFVLKNKSQLPKNVNAKDQAWRNVIDIRTYRRDEEVVPLIDKQIQRWVDEHPGDEKPSIVLLGRNRPKYLKGIDDEQVRELEVKWGSRVDFIEKGGKRSLFLSMHGSKGLQADYVMVLGMHRIEHDFFCFPSEREEDPLLQLVLPAKESRGDAEERRLFYVALTRAKHRVSLLTQEHYPSQYVLELLQEHQGGHLLFNGGEQLPEVCPGCKKSVLVARLNEQTQKKFLGCGSWKPGRDACGYTRNAQTETLREPV
jgi:DNA helicase IV